jgi:mono/diheme cytochrome c family protein
MQTAWTSLFVVAFLVAAGLPPHRAAETKETALAAKLQAQRTSALDLELGGELAGGPPGAVRYLTRDDLLALPQVTFTVTNDTNFTGPTQVSGVLLEELLRQLGAASESDMVVVVCDDQYRASYPQAYITAHHPLLVLKVNGQPPGAWPKDAEHGQNMGPFMISHRKFLPSFKVSALGDEAQIPWGVVRLEFREEKTVFAAIAPRGPHAADQAVQEGYWIARQNCFRCHNTDQDGRTKSGRPWLVLSAWATASPDYFAAYVRNPRSQNPHAQMPGNPAYNARITSALTAYFQAYFHSFSSSSTSSLPQEKP